MVCVCSEGAEIWEGLKDFILEEIAFAMAKRFDSLQTHVCEVWAVSCVVTETWLGRVWTAGAQVAVWESGAHGQGGDGSGRWNHAWCWRGPGRLRHPPQPGGGSVPGWGGQIKNLGTLH